MCAHLMRRGWNRQVDKGNPTTRPICGVWKTDPRRSPCLNDLCRAGWTDSAKRGIYWVDEPRSCGQRVSVSAHCLSALLSGVGPPPFHQLWGRPQRPIHSVRPNLNNRKSKKSWGRSNHQSKSRQTRLHQNSGSPADHGHGCVRVGVGAVTQGPFDVVAPASDGGISKQRTRMESPGTDLGGAGDAGHGD